MRLILPPAQETVLAPRGFAFHASYFTGRTLSTAGNGTNRTDFDILGGQASIGGNTVANSLMWLYWNLGSSSGLGAAYNMWDRMPMGITFRPWELALGAQGAIWIGLGDCRGTTWNDRRTNGTAKRILLTIERDAGGGRIAYFVTCNGGGVASEAIVAEPSVVAKERVTVTYHPVAQRAQLWYDDDLVHEWAVNIPSGAPSNVWGAADSVAGIGVHKTITGAAVIRVAASGFGAFVPDA